MLPQHVSVTLAGRVLPDGTEVPASAVYGLDGLSVSWGRASVWEQPEASALTLDVVLGPTPWPDWVATELLTVGAPVTVAGSVGAAPAPGAVVFAGTVTDVRVRWQGDWTSARASITAVDASRQAESDVVSAVPFPPEPAGARLDRIETTSATGQWAAARVSVDTVSVAGVDTDAQTWADLVRDTATAADAAAWPVTGPDPTGARPPGPGFLIEPIPSRPHVVTWHPDGAGGTTVGPRVGEPAGFTDLSACWAPRDPVEWSRTADTMITRVSVSWVDAAVPDDVTERTETMADPSREAVQGVQGAQVSTLLTSAAAARAYAVALLVRSSPQAWGLSGLSVDAADLTDDTHGAAVTRCMTVMAREGLPVVIRDLAPWSPAGARVLAFVEGGQAHFTAGQWLVDLVVSSIGGTGTPARWDDVPAAVPPWSWAGVDPAVRWIDVAVPVEP